MGNDKSVERQFDALTNRVSRVVSHAVNSAKADLAARGVFDASFAPITTVDAAYDALCDEIRNIIEIIAAARPNDKE